MWQDRITRPTPRALSLLTGGLLLVLALVIYLKWSGQLAALGVPANRRDLMFYSGFLVVLPALLASLRVDKLFCEALIQWREDSIATADAETWEQIYAGIAQTCHRWQYGGAIGVAIAVAIAYWRNYVPDPGDPLWHLVFVDPGLLAFILVSILLGSLAGYRLGTMAGVSKALAHLVELGSDIRIHPGHKDGIGGFRRVGALLAEQGCFASIPVWFLSAWLMLIGLNIEQPIEGGPPIRFGEEYGTWYFGYALLNAVGLVFLYVCFINPFLIVTRIYRAQRQEAYDALRVIDVNDLPEGERSGHIAKLETLRNLPTSPVFPKLQLTFTVTMAVPFFTLAANMVLPTPVRDALTNGARVLGIG